MAKRMVSGRGEKKEVRFSSPFENDLVDMQLISGKQKHMGQKDSATAGNSSSTSSKERSSSDSWDAFDAKMLKTKKGHAMKEIHNQFLELSSCQEKSLNIADDNFSAMSFQDAKDLIDKDENERLQFMNSDVSFSNGIEQVEPPSLLSVTDYFKQGSSFPVPYIGNESTMFGDNRSSFFLPSSLDDTSMSQTKTTMSSSNQQRQIGDSSSLSRKESLSLAELAPLSANQGPGTDLSRQDSLARFFLGSQSDGMNKADIMDYVLDYCKRRASLRLSDASDIVTSMNNNSTNSGSDRQDSGIGIGGDEKAVKHKDSMRADKEKVTNNDNSKVNSRERVQTTVCTKDNEDSVLITDATTSKQTEMLNASDVGGIESFEHFKKHLPLHGYHIPGRYKAGKEFEQRRLAVDERFSHPKLSPLAFRGPGSTATLERPSKKVSSNSSPPEKLTRHRTENAIDDSSSLEDLPAPNFRGQFHSTPVGVHNDSDMTNVGIRSLRKKEKSKSKKTDGEVLKESSREKKQRSVHTIRSHAESNASTYSDRSAFSSKSASSVTRDHGTTHAVPTKDAGTETRMHSETSKNETVQCTTSDSSLSKPNHLSLRSNDNINPRSSQMQVAQPSNEGLSVIPVIQSALQQQHQHSNGTPTCSCPHQCGQQLPTHGLHPTGGLPIVIHIHLPCAPPMAGTVAHTVPTTSSENSKM